MSGKRQITAFRLKGNSITGKSDFNGAPVVCRRVFRKDFVRDAYGLPGVGSAMTMQHLTRSLDDKKNYNYERTVVRYRFK
jgi:hypothetical protein